MARVPRTGDNGNGPVIWWLRNDLRLEDNPVARLAASEAFLNGRLFAPVFVFDPRFLDHSLYGRVTDPDFKKSIATRRPVAFGNRKCSALRARFLLQCVRSVAAQLAGRGSRLTVCHGLAEEVLGAAPLGSLVVCQQEPVSVECTDIEESVQAALERKGGSLRCEWGAMSLYHRQDLPFHLDDSEIPNSFSELGGTLGWDDIWTAPGRSSSATQVRSPEDSPTVLPVFPTDFALRGAIPEEVLADDARALKHLGYSDAEVREALGQEIPEGGEPYARALLESWLGKQGVESGDNPQAPVFWDLPVGCVPVDGHDALQWANLARPEGWTRMSHYLAVGCISAREIFARAAECPNFNGVAHRLLWREFHRLNAIRHGRRLFWLQGPGWIERPWSSDSELAEAWKEGKTGVPYIDACMRELRQTGWLAYKGRKTAAFFLVFGLGLDWRLGAFHFEDVLLDYDCAMNYGNWVTVAAVDKPGRGSWGPEATVADLVEAYREDLEWKLSAEMKNDPSGEYIRHWLPELKAVPDEFIHRPWALPPEEAQQCQLKLGEDYPESLMGPLFVCTDEEAWEQRWREQHPSVDGPPQDAGETQSGPKAAVSDDCCSTERRVHPEDKSGRAYTYTEFMEFASSLGESEPYGQRLWQEAISTKELRQRLAKLQARVQELEQELESLRTQTST